MTYDDDPRSDIDRITDYCIVSQSGARLAYCMIDTYRKYGFMDLATRWQRFAYQQHEDAKYYLDQLLCPVKEGQCND
jgi:hypothetical protein